jgi:hypothetical protein
MKKPKTDPNDTTWAKLGAAENRIAHAQNALAHFLEEHEEVFSQFFILQREEAVAIEQAKSLYAENIALAGSAWGGFRVQERRTFNAVELYENLDDDVAARVLETKLSVRRDAYDEAVANNEIPAVLAKRVEVVEYAIFSPKTVLSSLASGKSK